MQNNKNKRKKIVVIGAGSSSFGLSTLAEIMLTKELHGMELSLVDINIEGLNEIKTLAEILNDKWNANMKLSVSGDRKDVLLNADYVIISIAVDREKCWRSDYEIALKYNLSHYAENGGPGGFIHAARNISMLLSILDDIGKLCPNAFILNLTNPMQRICNTIKIVSKNKFVGICDQIYFGYFILGTAFAKDFGIKLNKDPRFLWNEESLDYHFDIIKNARKYISLKAAGINHFTWMVDVRDKKTGEDISDIVKKKMLGLPTEFEPLTQEMFRIFNYIPVSGDCHISEYLPYVSDLSSETFKKYDIQMYSFEWGIRMRNNMWKDIEMMIKGEKDIEHLKYSINEAITEEVSMIIASIENNSNYYSDIVNIPNRGNITNLPMDAIVEVPGLISGNGVTGLAMGSLPETIAELCRRQIILNDLTVQAVIEGSVKLVYQLFALDPMINNLNTAVKLANEYIKENIKYLPTFR
jgi:alpha-galactosidase